MLESDAGIRCYIRPNAYRVCISLLSQTGQPYEFELDKAILYWKSSESKGKSVCLILKREAKRAS